MTGPTGLIFSMRTLFEYKGPGWLQMTLIPEELVYILERTPDIEIEYYDIRVDRVFRLLNCRENLCLHCTSLFLTAKDETNHPLEIEWDQIDWNGFHICG